VCNNAPYTILLQYKELIEKETKLRNSKIQIIFVRCDFKAKEISQYFNII